ncbi:MAG TPA: abortive infection protein [Oxalobacteraceae bacterium]|nr:abortive infection protein [Oxalobacteraceae bacterium]
MLLEFGLRNFFSFKEGASLSLRLDANCPESISRKRDFTHVLCVKGANGSGKTQLLKGLAFLSHFCTNSFASEPEETIGVSSFYDSEEPSQFYAEFKINEDFYRYELETTDTEVRRETIFQTKTRKRKVLERIGNELTVKTRPFANLDKIKIRKNASIISTAHQYELNELDDIYRFFNLMIANVHIGGLHEEPMSMDTVSNFLATHEKVFGFVKKFIRECDVGVSNIEISTFKNREGKEEFFPVFFHKVNGQDLPVIDMAESSGTKTLFRNLASYYYTLNSGGILIVDELDMNLHPHILPKLVNLFLDPEINSNDAQFIFSTHDSEILNMLGRYRTYLVAKEENESYVYRLDEIPGDILRNDRPIRPIYNEGRIGGVPRL